MTRRIIIKFCLRCHYYRFDISLFHYISNKLFSPQPSKRKLHSFPSFFLICASRFTPLSSTSRIIMTSTLTQAQQGPLHFLAHVICATDSASIPSRNSTPMSSSSLDLPCCHVPSSSRTPFQGVAILHIPCKNTEAGTEKKPLKRSNSSNQISNVDTHFVPFIRHKSGGRSRKSAEVNLKSRTQMKVKRQELLQKATKIKSLDNSPVNEHQLLVLRMVFDEITMYPCESWMVLIAIIIRRSVPFLFFALNQPQCANSNVVLTNK